MWAELFSFEIDIGPSYLGPSLDLGLSWFWAELSCTQAEALSTNVNVYTCSNLALS